MHRFYEEYPQTYHPKVADLVLLKTKMTHYQLFKTHAHLYKRVSIYVLLGFVSFNLAFSQENQNDNMVQYFDDGGMSEKNNFIKVNAASIVAGDLSFSYERTFEKKIGLELSYGFILPFYVWEFGTFGLDAGMNSTISPTGGYSYNLQFKYYYYSLSSNSDGMFIGFKYRKRNYKQETYDFDFNDYYINLGVQYFISNRMLLAYELGLGFRYSNTFNYEGTEDEYIDMILPIAIKASYLF